MVPRCFCTVKEGRDSGVLFLGAFLIPDCSRGACCSLVIRNTKTWNSIFFSLFEIVWPFLPRLVVGGIAVWGQDPAVCTARCVYRILTLSSCVCMPIILVPDANPVVPDPYPNTWLRQEKCTHVSKGSTHTSTWFVYRLIWPPPASLRPPKVWKWNDAGNSNSEAHSFILLL